MLGIADLPDEVLERILRICVGKPATCMRNWKSNFLFLRVCRQWRILAVPHVYSHALIHHNQSDPGGRPLYSNTNVDFILAQSYWQHVRRLSITAMGVSSELPALAAIAETLSRQQALFAQVRCLSVRSMTSSIDNDMPPLASLSEVAETMASALPNVRQLTINSGSVKLLSRTFAGLLADLLIGALQRLESGLPMSLGARAFSSQLAYLNIALSETGAQHLPRMHARSLKALTLRCVPRGFSWALFADRMSEPRVCFAELCDLAMHYRPPKRECADAGTLSAVNIQFPKLRRLRVERLPASCKPLFTAEYPPYVEYMYFSGSSDTIRYLKLLRLNRVGSIEVEQLLAYKDTCHDVYDAASHVFGAGATDSISKGALTIRDSVIHASPGRLPWAWLTQLRLYGCCEFSVLQDLLWKLPRLQQLILHGLMTTDTGADASIPANGRLPPVSSTLARLTLRDSDECQNLPQMVGSIQRLLLRLPRLARLNLSDNIDIDRNFIDSHAQLYPHLRSLCIKVYDY
ncbi:hypothetical protein H4R23_000227 [Coemansia sp. Cherry 401B]|nr:hypothetical protein H4R23_000227 [Coemansia sp. Cherry 401B]